MTLSHSPSIVRDGLVLYLDAANPKSYPATGETWYDLSGNGNNGVANGSLSYESFNNGYMIFDGVDDYVGPISTISDGTWNAGSWTVGFWVNFTNVATGVDNTLMTHGVQSANNGLHLVERSGKAYFGLWSNDLASAQSLIAGTWYNIAYTFNFSTKLKSIYINGVLDNSGGTVGYSGTGSNTRIGTSVGLLRYLRAKLGTVCIYNVPLSENEIKENFNALRGRYGI
jgi:hypothetical protein